MDNLIIPIQARADLDKGIKKTYLDMLFATQDDAAHQVDVQLMRGKEEIDLSGAGISAYFIRYSDNATITLNGSASGNIASVTLKKSCYNRPGSFALIIKAAVDGVISTVFYGEGSIFASSTDTILDEENVIPSLSDLLAQIAAMEAGTKAATTAAENANTAAENANAAAQHAPYVDEATNHWMAWDTTSGQYIDTGANATGDKGDKGDKGEPGKDGTGAGTVTGVKVGSELHEPDDSGVVDLGELGGDKIKALTSDPREAEEEAPEMGSVPINADSLGGKSLADIMLMLYPVGSIYMSANSVSPQTLFGGEWEQLKGRMLIGTGAPEANDDGTSPGEYNYPAGSKGGETTHKLTADEMPTHDHTEYIPSWVSEGYFLAKGSDYGSSRQRSGETGGGEAHNNMPPYLAVNMWKRVS